MRMIFSYRFNVAILRHVYDFIYFFCDAMEPNEYFVRVLIETPRER